MISHNENLHIGMPLDIKQRYKVHTELIMRAREKSKQKHRTLQHVSTEVYNTAERRSDKTEPRKGRKTGFQFVLDITRLDDPTI